MTKFKIVLVAAGFVIVVLVLGATCGRFLVINEAHQSDVIVVLAGETDQRLIRGLEALDQGYATRLLLDVPAKDKIYGWDLMDLAQKYVGTLPQANRITICPIYALSTRSEVADVSRCLQGSGSRKILLITSDFHTRRALSTFTRVAPADYSVAAAFDPRTFGVQWWKHRQWAKTNLTEWAKLIWWELIDRWR
jgi:uncharacterized SAM-binding protein YcdF (DUF218 family)